MGFRDTMCFTNEATDMWLLIFVQKETPPVHEKKHMRGQKEPWSHWTLGSQGLLFLFNFMNYLYPSLTIGVN